MNKDRLLSLLKEYNIPLNSVQIEGLLKEYENISLDDENVQKEILEKVRKFINVSVNPNKLNDLIEYTIGKTSLNYFLNHLTLNSVIDRISKEFKEEKIAYETYYSYLKNAFIEALVLSVGLVIDNENINKVSVNDTFIEANMNLFDDLGFIIKVLEDDELQMLFPEKTIEERNKFKYYAYIPKDKYLSIYAH